MDDMDPGGVDGKYPAGMVDGVPVLIDSDEDTAGCDLLTDPAGVPRTAESAVHNNPARSERQHAHRLLEHGGSMEIGHGLKTQVGDL